MSSKKVKTDTIFVVKKSVLPLFGGSKITRRVNSSLDEKIVININFLYEIKTQPGVLLRPKHQPLCENGLLTPQIY